MPADQPTNNTVADVAEEADPWALDIFAKTEEAPKIQNPAEESFQAIMELAKANRSLIGSISTRSVTSQEQILQTKDVDAGETTDTMSVFSDVAPQVNYKRARYTLRDHDENKCPDCLGGLYCVDEVDERINGPVPRKTVLNKSNEQDWETTKRKRVQETDERNHAGIAANRRPPPLLPEPLRRAEDPLLDPNEEVVVDIADGTPEEMAASFQAYAAAKAKLRLKPERKHYPDKHGRNTPSASGDSKSYRSAF